MRQWFSNAACVITAAALLCAGAPAWAIHTAGYFPLTFGNNWQYNNLSAASLNAGTLSGPVTGATTASVFGAFFSVNGANARQIDYTGPSHFQQFFTNDSNGVIQSREIDFNVPINLTINGVAQPTQFVTQTITLTPGLQFVPSEATLGQHSSSSGTATVTLDSISIGNCGKVSFNVNYSAGATVQTFQTVTVPAGTFDTAVVAQTLTVSGTVASIFCPNLGQSVALSPPLAFNSTASATSWLANGVGLVQELDGDGTALVLTSYTVPALTPSVGNPQFNRQPLHTTSPPQLVTLTSSGTAGLNSPFIGVVDFQGQGQFNLASNDCPPAMAMGAQCTIGITYTPSLIGPNSGVANIFFNNDPTAYQVVNLSGTNAHARRADFGGDGRSDIFWLNTASTQAYVWQMNGTNIASSGSPASTGGDPMWQVAGFGDFDGDGRNDVLFRHAATGATTIWLMNGTALANAGSPGTIADLGWKVQGVGDFDGDGMADILWMHTDGTVLVWLMNRTSIKFAGGVAGLGPNSGWSVQGIGDFDGDGRADVLWQHSSGTVVVWRMNGTTIVSSGSPANVGPMTATGWTVQGVGDFDGDGRADILWRNDDLGGIIYVWLMNGAAISSANAVTGVGTATGTGWIVKSIGDYDGDGKADIFWKNDLTLGGITYVWLMNGTAISVADSVTGVADFNWQIQNPK